jgi:hypothetical protein
MPTQEPAPARSVDSDGVVRIEQRRSGGATWVLGLGIALTCVCLGLSAWLVFDKPEVESLPVALGSEPVRVESPAPVPAPAPGRPVVAKPVRPAAAPELPKHLRDRLDH